MPRRWVCLAAGEGAGPCLADASVAMPMWSDVTGSLRQAHLGRGGHACALESQVHPACPSLPMSILCRVLL